jgi:hypothetical protein
MAGILTIRAAIVEVYLAWAAVVNGHGRVLRYKIDGRE